MVKTGKLKDLCDKTASHAQHAEVLSGKAVKDMDANSAAY